MFSGGIDSVSLLHILHALKIPVTAFHFNHQLRADAGKQEEFARTFCQTFGIPLVVEGENIREMARAQKKSLEQMGRERRYFWAEEVRKRKECAWIATAHTASDQVETILMRMLTGAELEGMRGIAPVSGVILRPLIEIFRAQVEDYAHQHGLIWFEDPSNRDLRFFRNRIRHQLIPFLQELRPGFQKALLRSAGYWREDADYLEQKAREHFAEFASVEKIPVPLPLPPAFQRRFLRLFLQQKGWEITGAKIGRLLQLTQSPVGKKIRIAPDRVAVRDRGYIWFSPILQYPEHTLPIPGETEEFLLEIQPYHPNLHFSNSAHEAYIDEEKLKKPLHIRLWRAGDRFIPLGRKSEKKVKKFLTDARVSATVKPFVRIIEDEEKIVWLVGLRLDERVKIGPHTRRVLHIVWKKPFPFK